MSVFYQLPTIAAITAVIVLVQPQIALALEATEVNEIAQGITVLIDGISNGSGVIVRKQGNTYFVLTAKHAIQREDEYEIVTSDGRRYLLDYRTVRKIEGVDLAIIEFTSNVDYPIASFGNSDELTEGSLVYTAGWPAPGHAITERTYSFTNGTISGRQLTGTDGYNLIYTNITRKGMSGGPILNERGQVIGIHGLAEGEIVSDPISGTTVAVKAGFNLGIPINLFALSRVWRSLRSGRGTTVSRPPEAPLPETPPRYSSVPENQSKPPRRIANQTPRQPTPKPPRVVESNPPTVTAVAPPPSTSVVEPPTIKTPPPQAETLLAPPTVVETKPQTTITPTPPTVVETKPQTTVTPTPPRLAIAPENLESYNSTNYIVSNQPGEVVTSDRIRQINMVLNRYGLTPVACNTTPAIELTMRPYKVCASPTSEYPVGQSYTLNVPFKPIVAVQPEEALLTAEIAPTIDTTSVSLEKPILPDHIMLNDSSQSVSENDVARINAILRHEGLETVNCASSEASAIAELILWQYKVCISPTPAYPAGTIHQVNRNR